MFFAQYRRSFWWTMTSFIIYVLHTPYIPLGKEKVPISQDMEYGKSGIWISQSYFEYINWVFTWGITSTNDCSLIYLYRIHQLMTVIWYIYIKYVSKILACFQSKSMPGFSMDISNFRRFNPKMNFLKRHSEIMKSLCMKYSF